MPYYFCTIENEKAEIYTYTLGLHLDDTVVIDTKAKLMTWKTATGSETGSISVSTDDGYYNYINQHPLLNK